MSCTKVVYLHRKLSDDSIFYVGMGEKGRAYNKHHRSKWWKKIAKKYGYRVEIYKEGLTVQEACDLEIELIAKYGRLDLKTGILVNQTKGGLSVEGMSRSSSRKKSKKLRGHKKSEEFKRRVSEAMTGRKLSDETKQKLSKLMTGKKMPEYVKQKMRESNKSKIVTAKKVACYCAVTLEFIGQYSSIKEASEDLGCLSSSISNNAAGLTKVVLKNKLNKPLKFNTI